MHGSVNKFYSLNISLQAVLRLNENFDVFKELFVCILLEENQYTIHISGKITIASRKYVHELITQKQLLLNNLELSQRIDKVHQSNLSNSNFKDMDFWSFEVGRIRSVEVQMNGIRNVKIIKQKQMSKIVRFVLVKLSLKIYKLRSQIEILINIWFNEKNNVKSAVFVLGFR